MQERVASIAPAMRELARRSALRLGVRNAEKIRECQQVGMAAVAEVIRTWNPTLGDLEVFAWKRVVGAVKRHLHEERAHRGLLIDEDLSSVDGTLGTTDPFDDEEVAQDDAHGNCRRTELHRYTQRVSAAARRSPHNDIVRARALDALEMALGARDEREKQFLSLRYWQGATWAEVACSLQMSERHAKRLDVELRERLCRDLKRRGVEEVPPSA